jgi:DNA excision repair protein ERCC-4
MNKELLKITADFREQHSGIPELLVQKGIVVSISNIKTGDYLIGNELLVERKSANDFVLSLLTGRLFKQCSYLARSGLRPLILIEGKIFGTRHKVDHQALQGALLSVAASWQIPLIYSKNTTDSANMLYMLCRQAGNQTALLRHNTFKPKRLYKHQMRFLQGLPNIGAVSAFKLLKHFGNIQAVINADLNGLQEVEGIGKKTAEKIKAFVSVNADI